ncbi:hypothetical protein PUN28_014989 [Cardiocondyla obscurior]|uniref:Uncharacterized protein n=1 Tax=Cardiocondyla obscurior TaxID=286306 RepID=A0AAW2EYN3_9HYME
MRRVPVTDSRDTSEIDILELTFHLLTALIGHILTFFRHRTFASENYEERDGSCHEEVLGGKFYLGKKQLFERPGNLFLCEKRRICFDWNVRAISTHWCRKTIGIGILISLKNAVIFIGHIVDKIK